MAIFFSGLKSENILVNSKNEVIWRPTRNSIGSPFSSLGSLPFSTFFLKYYLNTSPSYIGKV